MTAWKKLLALLLAMLLPLTALAEGPAAADDEELDLGEIVDLEEPDPADESTEDFGLTIDDDLEDSLSELDMELDDSIDRGKLDLNENLPDNVVNILLIGIDTRSKDLDAKDGNNRGDVQIILSINKDDGSVKLSSFQRDLYVTLPGYKNKNRINVAYRFGETNPKLNGSGGQLAMRTINRNFEMNLEYYVTINFYGLASIIDALGGVDLELTAAEAKHINSYLRQHPPAYDNQDKEYVRQELEGVDGVQHLDGIQAVMYARTRHSTDADNDGMRNERQRKLLEVLLRKVMDNMSAVRLMELLETALPYVKTNMPAMEMLRLATDLLANENGLLARLKGGDALLSQMGIPMEGTFRYQTINGNSVVAFTSGGQQQNVEALHTFIYGQYIPAN